MSPTVTVIIPCYNGSRFLREAVASVFAQTLTGWECLIVDDGSTDDSLVVAHQLAAEFPALKVATKRNGGRASALNLGLKQIAPGTKYVLFFDADDVLHPAFLARTTDYLDSNSEVTGAGVQFWEFGEDIKAVTPKIRSRYVPGRWAPRNLPLEEPATPFVVFYCCTGQGPFILFRRSAVDVVQGFDERFNQDNVHGNEDTDLFCRVAMKGAVHFLPERLYFKRTHSGNVTKTQENGYKLFRSIWDERIREMTLKRSEMALLPRYYYRVHRPLRDLKISKMAFGEFCHEPDWLKLRWALSLLASGLPRLLLWYPWFITAFRWQRKQLDARWW